MFKNLIYLTQEEDIWRSVHVYENSWDTAHRCPTAAEHDRDIFETGQVRTVSIRGKIKKEKKKKQNKTWNQTRKTTKTKKTREKKKQFWPCSHRYKMHFLPWSSLQRQLFLMTSVWAGELENFLTVTDGAEGAQKNHSLK